MKGICHQYVYYFKELKHFNGGLIVQFKRT